MIRLAGNAKDADVGIEAEILMAILVNDVARNEKNDSPSANLEAR